MGRQAEALTAPAALAVQGPFLAYLSGQSPAGFVALSAVSVALAAALRDVLPRAGLRGSAPTLSFHLTLGSLGMLVGWWADAGLGPIVGRGICLCGCSDSLVGFGVVSRLHWMQACMLIACSAATLTGRPVRGLNPFRAAEQVLVSSLLMLVGMAAASWATAGLRIADPASALLASYIAMTAGMAAGLIAASRISGILPNLPDGSPWGPSLTLK